MSDAQPRAAFLLPDMRAGGAERVGLQLIRDFIAKGVAVDLLLIKREGELLALLPPEVRVIDLNARRLRHALRPLVKYLREERPAAIQAFMWPLTVIAVVAHRLARSRARLVLSDHTMLSRHYGGSALRLLRVSTRLFYPLADARVIVSEGAADDLAQISGLKRSSIEVIYNPVPAPPPENRGASEMDDSWGGEGVRVLTIGTLKEEKNHVLLIRAFAAFARSRTARLMIVGEGPMRERLQQAAAEEGVGDRVLLPGFALDPWPYYRSADLFVLSSDFEGYPLVLLEAMRCGLKIVSTECGSSPRTILDDGTYGELVPCGDTGALAEAMERAAQRPIDANALKERAEQLSGAGTSARYLELMLGLKH